MGYKKLLIGIPGDENKFFIYAREFWLEDEKLGDGRLSMKNTKDSLIEYKDKFELTTSY